MLALLDSLTSVGFDVDDQGRRALDWADRGAYTPDGDGKFDIGNATADALARIRNGEPAQTAGGAGERDLGNGSLMRILPDRARGLGCDRRRARGTRPSRVRGHASAHGRAGHVRAVRARRAAPARGRDRPRRRARRRAHDASASSTGNSIRPRCSSTKQRSTAWKRGRSALAVASSSTASGARGTRSPAPRRTRRPIVRAIRYGHDTDTTACIAGGLAGLYWGIDGIPREWREGMRGATIVEPMLDRLLTA